MRAAIALFFCSVGVATAVLCFRELRRRGHCVPPGVVRHPWLAPTGYVTVIHFISPAVFAAFVICLGHVHIWST